MFGLFKKLSDNPIELYQNIENGTIECDISSATAGDTVTVTATPNEHYQLGSITVNGEAIKGNSFTSRS